MNEVKISGTVEHKGRYHLLLQTDTDRFRIEATAGILKFIEVNDTVNITGSLIATSNGGIAVASRIIDKEES